MTKIGKNSPLAHQYPVYINESRYEIWRMNPESLGVINKVGYGGGKGRGKYRWLTVDGMEFRTSKQAMAYLVKLREQGTSAETASKAIRDAAYRDIVYAGKQKPERGGRLGEGMPPLDHSEIVRETVSQVLAELIRRGNSNLQ